MKERILLRNVVTDDDAVPYLIDARPNAVGTFTEVER